MSEPESKEKTQPESADPKATPAAETEMSETQTLIEVKDDFGFSYGTTQVLFDLNLRIPNRKVTA